MRNVYNGVGRRLTLMRSFAKFFAIVFACYPLVGYGADSLTALSELARKTLIKTPLLDGGASRVFGLQTPLSPPAQLAPQIPLSSVVLPVISMPTAVVSFVKQSPNELFRQWQRLLVHSGTFSELVCFIEQHPDWPRQTDLRQKAEKALDDAQNNAVSILTIIQFFDRYRPQTGRGQFYYARALLMAGRIEDAKHVFNILLTQFIIPAELIPELKRYEAYLPFSWAFRQANMLLYHQKTMEVQAILPYLTPDEGERVAIRLHLLQKNFAVIPRAMVLIQSSNHMNEGLIFDLIRYYRQLKTADGDNEAVRLFHTYTFLDEAIYPALFWGERNILVRRMLEAKRSNDAYLLAKGHGFSIKKQTHPHEIRCAEDCANAFCMTSWLALRAGNDPARALASLQEIENVVKSPITKARVYYWLAETYIALNNNEEVKNHLKKAAEFPTTFYGQLALSHLNEYYIRDKKEPVKPTLFPDITITATDRSAFENLEIVKAIRSVPEIVNGANCDSFFFALLALNPKLEFQHMVFELAEQMKARSYAIRLSKRTHMTFPVAYPSLRLQTQKETIDYIAPKSRFKALLHSLVHAIIRRESCFDDRAKSSAGALGLMQLMPATAQKETKALKRFGIHMPRINLFEKVKYIILGTSHIEGLLETYQGSLILSIAAYNAGTKPVDEWIETYGDPRLKNVDVVHWIESIPFAETRNYVQRVLENFMVYEQLLFDNHGSRPNLLAQIMPKG